MVKFKNAQKWLESKYPSGKRDKIKKLDISNKNLEGPLKLEGFNSLEKLDCSNNLITELDLSSCNTGKLIELNVGNNDFDQDLTCFSNLTKLEKLYLGSGGSRKRIEFNCFTGSLKPLKELLELKKLDISNTDISSGLEYLPESLEKLYCFNYRGDEAGCERIRKELESYFNESDLCYDLWSWRRVQKNRNKKLILYGSSTVAQEWLDREYLKKDKGDQVGLDISRSKLAGKTILEGTLNLTDFKDLKVLDCSGQRLTKLELIGYEQLKELNCENNQLTSLNVSGCSKLIRVKCSENKLTNLTIINCPQLNSLHCSNNSLTDFDFESLNKEKLILLDLNNNRLSSRNLDELTPFVNLESINIGSSDRDKIEGGGYNRFHGSLKSLRKMIKLQFLNIEATDIDSGLEYLPESLAVFYCASCDVLTEVDKIEKILKGFPDSLQTQALPVPSSQSSLSLILPTVEKAKTFFSNSNFDSNYFENLQRWREDNGDLIKAAKMVGNNHWEPGTHELVEESAVSQNLTEKIREKEKLINFLKAKYQGGEEECLELLCDVANELKSLKNQWQLQEQKAVIEETFFQRN